MESNGKPNYQPWNEEEFQADVFVRGMTWLQRHLYRSLLQAAFFHSTRPYLPNDDEVLWVLAGAESQDMWEQNKTKILKRFSVPDHDANLLESKRVTSDWNRLLNIRETASSQGSAGGQRSAEVRRTKYGTAQPFKPLVITPSNAPSNAFEEKGSNVEACNVSEVKRSNEMISESAAVTDSCSDQERTQASDWKNIAVRHYRLFSKKPSVKFKDKYFEACKEYTEEVVLDCFDSWSQGARDWVKRENVEQPLYSFFKKLPEEAADAVELREAVQEDDHRLTTEKQKADAQKQRELAANEASIARQREEVVKRMEATPVVAEDPRTPEEFMAGE